MSDKSGIQWTDATWNPVTGCSKVSQGCKNCYALRDWARVAAPRPTPNVYTGREFTDVRFHPERLDQPLRWKKPRRVFVNSMSDLFHEKVPDEAIERILTATIHAKAHTFQILTKRPERMRSVMQRWTDMNGRPQTNLWMGVSVEDQATADERIPLLLKTPAAVRFVSYEPALGPVTFPFSAQSSWCPICTAIVYDTLDSPHEQQHGVDSSADFDPTKHCASVYDMLHWIIVGGESGPGARPCDVAWIRSAVEQCKAAGVPCFVKQLGARPVTYSCAMREKCTHPDCAVTEVVLRDRKGGDTAEWPEDLRVREMPR